MDDTKPRLSLKSKLLFLVVLIVSVVIPVQFWYGVWFGRQLDDQELRGYLGDFHSPRRIQHALTQIAEQLEKGDGSGVRRWYPQLGALSDHPLPQVRVQLAWVMGLDPESEVFHDTLRRLAADSDPLVHRNAALSLVRFDDTAALPVIRRMLQPVPVAAPGSGTLDFSEQEGSAISGQMEFAVIRSPDGSELSVRAPVEGWLRPLHPSGFSVQPGQEIALLEPSPLHAWEALRALYLMGEPEDLALVEPYLTNTRYDEQIRRQAELTAQAIVTRTKPEKTN